MPLRNLIQDRLNANDRQTINQALTTIADTLKGKTVQLTADEFQRYGSINEQAKLVVNKIKDLRDLNANFAAPEVDWAEFDRDYEARVFLEQTMSKIMMIHEALRGTKTLHDKDNYDDSLAMYQYLEYLSKRGVMGAEEAYEGVKQFFTKTSQPKKKMNDGNDDNGGDVGNG